MTRQPLPGRRQSRTRTLTWTDDNTVHVFELTVGFNAAGEVREIFANSPKIRNQVKAQIDDALVVFSRALQFGDTIAGIAASLGREGLDPESPAASIYGLMARAAVEMEADEGRDVWALARRFTAPITSSARPANAGDRSETTAQVPEGAI